MKRAAFIAAACLAFPATASADVSFHLMGDVSARTQAAMLHQLNDQVQPHWHTQRAVFGHTGIRVYIKPQRFVESYCEDDNAGGCHSLDDNGNPVIYVGHIDFSIVLSHELIETLVDPMLDGYEPCDDVEDAYYKINGIDVANFAFPNHNQNWLHVHYG